MKIYTVGDQTHECYGHGDYGDEIKIQAQGAYGMGDFPPCFTTKEKAQEYIKRLSLNARKVVVELELVDQ